MLDAESCLARPVTSETEYRLGDSGSTQLDPLFGKSDAKPFCAFSRKPASTCNCSVAIGVCLDDSHNARCWAYTVFDLIEVCGQVVEIDFGPCRTPRKNVLLIVGR